MCAHTCAKHVNTEAGVCPCPQWSPPHTHVYSQVPPWLAARARRLCTQAWVCAHACPHIHLLVRVCTPRTGALSRTHLCAHLHTNVVPRRFQLEELQTERVL